MRKQRLGIHTSDYSQLCWCWCFPSSPLPALPPPSCLWVFYFLKAVALSSTWEVCVHTAVCSWLLWLCRQVIHMEVLHTPNHTKVQSYLCTCVYMCYVCMCVTIMSGFCLFSHFYFIPFSEISPALQPPWLDDSLPLCPHTDSVP